MKRYGQVIRIKADKETYYRKLHANVWSSVKNTIRECNITNYSIFIRDGLLFAYFEYVGENFDKDMKKMSEDPETKRWWAETSPCQEPIETHAQGEWWVNMEEVFYME